MLGLPDPRRAYALLIGVENYPRSAQPYQALPASRHSVGRLHDLLTDTGSEGVMWRLPRSRVNLLTDPSAEDASAALLDATTRQDVDSLLVCVSCHGSRYDPGVGPPGLHLAMGTSRRDRPGSHWHYDEIRRDLQRAHAQGKIRQILLIVDACYADGLGEQEGQAGAAPPPDDELAVRGVSVLSATKYRVQAWPKWRDTQHTAFLGALIETIEEGIPGPDEVLSATQVFHDASRRMLLEKRNDRNISDPDIWRQGAGEIPLCRNRKRMAPVLIEDAAASSPENALILRTADDCFGAIREARKQRKAENEIQGIIKNFCGDPNVSEYEIASLLKLLGASELSGYAGSVYAHFCAAREPGGIARFADELHHLTMRAADFGAVVTALRKRDDGGPLARDVYRLLRESRCADCAGQAEEFAILLVTDEELSRPVLSVWR